MLLLQRTPGEGSDEAFESEVEAFLSSHSKWQRLCETTLSPAITQAQKESDIADGVRPAEQSQSKGTNLSDSEEESNTGEKRKRKQGRPQSKQLRALLSSKVDSAEVLLPSSYVPAIRSQPCLETAVQVELELRKAQAADCLNLLRTHLITSYTFEKTVKKRAPSGATGHKAITRNKSRAFQKRSETEQAANAYRRAYHALVGLGLKKSADFKKLDPKDVRPFVVRTSDQQLGDSKSQPSWIWQKLEFLKTKDVMKSFRNYAEQGNCPL